jgi:ribosomal protein S12 methylthiotransferase accessory factor
VDATPVAGRGLVVLLAHGHELFAGPEYAAVGGAVDGTRTQQEVLAAARSDGISDADLRHALDELRAAGVLVDRDDRLDPAAAAYWFRDGHSPADVGERLARARLELAVVGDVDAAPVVDALAAEGLAPEGGGSDLLVVLTDDYLRPELAECNADALQRGRPWLLAAPEAAELLLGPVFVPDRGACWECLAQRLRRHRAIESYLRDAAGREPAAVRPGGSLPATRAAAAGMVATHVLRALVVGHGALAESLVSVDPRTWQATRHALTRRPQCPACGFPDVELDRPARPPGTGAPAPRQPRSVAALRTVTPEATVERFEHHVSRISGVVHRLTRASGAQPPLHVYLAGQPGPRTHGRANGWSPGVTTPPGGKGTTEAQARASALCEALERYSGEFQGDEPRRSGSLAELEPAALHPNECMGFSASQYARREETNARAQSQRTFVPVPFAPDATVDWTPLWSLTHETERLLPTAYCYYTADVPGRDACLADSNGNAAGNSIDEAILHGLLELVERDHVALWWYNRLRAPGVDLDALADPWLDEARARLDSQGRKLWALDLTADLGIPVVAAVAVPGSRAGGVSLGFAAHPDLRLATVRAVTELVQLSAGAPSGGAGEGPTERLDPAVESFLRPAEDVTPGGGGDVGGPGTGDIATDLAECAGRVEAAGLEILALDQTRPDIGLPVVKVVVPGLRHFWPRFAGGRLYDVPVAMSLLPEPLSEDALNPVPPVE